MPIPAAPLLMAKKAATNKYVIAIVLVVLLLLISKKAISKTVQKIRERKFDKNEAANVNQIAQQYRSVSNPSGISWMIDFDGTDTDQIDSLAHQSKRNFPEIAKAYRLKFGEGLTDRMRAELSNQDFTNWQNIIQ